MVGSDTSPPLALSLRMFAVRLSGMDMNPQFVNPPTLVLNGVVDESWICEKGAQTGLTESRFGYTNGVRVEAFEDTVCFRHYGTDLVAEKALSSELAQRYAALFDPQSWFDMSLEFGAVIRVSGCSAVRAPVPGFADSLTLDEVAPRFSTNFIYEYPDRTLSIEFSQNLSSRRRQLNCLSRIRHDLHYNDEDEPEEHLRSALSNLKSEWMHIVSTVTRLASVTLRVGDTQ